MRQVSRHRRYSRALRVAGTMAITFTGITCRDAGVGPGLPTRTSISVAPGFQRAAEPGGPTFESLRGVHGILDPLDGSTTYRADALFTNDTATLVFDVVFHGTSQRYSLSLAATDTAGDTLFASTRDITATPGTSRTVDERLRYVGADTAVSFLGLATSDTMVLAGDSIVATAVGYDGQNRGISPLHVGWTSRDGTTLAVESRGPATARILGGDAERDGWIVARTFNGVADSVRVRAMLRVAAVALSHDTLRLFTGDALSVTAEALDAKGTILDRALAWSTDDPAVATVVEPQIVLPARTARQGAASAAAKSAVVTAVAPGVTRVVAASTGKADTAVVVVSSPPIARTTVSPDSWRFVYLGEELQLSASSFTPDSTPANGRYAWLVDPSTPGVVTVDATGRVAAVGTGAASVIVTEAGGTADTARISVVQVATAVFVDPPSVALPIGSMQQFFARAVDAKGNPIPNAVITWSTTGRQVARVDGTGLVSFDNIGIDTVFASVDGVTAQASVRVVSPIAAITVSGPQLLDAVGATTVLRALATDSTGKPIPDVTLFWDSKDRTIVTPLEAAGDSAIVRAEGVGATTITASSGGAVGSLDISVTSGGQVGTRVLLAPDSLLLGLGGQGRFTATLVDATGQPVAVSPAEVQWGIEGAATVVALDASGEVTAKEVGKTAVFATIRAIRSASAAVNVSDVAPMIARFSADTIRMGVDTATVSLYLASASTAPVSFTLAVADGTARFATSSVVFQPGTTRIDVLLTGVQPGTTTITATDVDQRWSAASAIVIVGGVPR